MSDVHHLVPEPPPRFRGFAQSHPEVFEAYQGLGKAAGESGPLDERTRRLVRLGIAVGARLSGAIKAHTRMALHEGISEEEIRHAVVLAITTLGLPSMMAALDQVEEEIERIADQRF